jgi:hypothetical protein
MCKSKKKNKNKKNFSNDHSIGQKKKNKKKIKSFAKKNIQEKNSSAVFSVIVVGDTQIVLTQSKNR